MALDQDIRVLSAAEIFDQLTAEQLRLLAFGAERLQFRAGRHIYRQGERADCGFVIAAGSVALSRPVNGDDAVVQVAGPGKVLGQLALITETERMTNAVAEADCEVLRINRSLFRRMLAEYPETAAAIHQQLSVQLQSFLDEIARLESRFKVPRDL